MRSKPRLGHAAVFISSVNSLEIADRMLTKNNSIFLATLRKSLGINDCTV
jgi:hypothetical protein